MKEIWKTCRQNHNYTVSNLGRVYSKRRDKILTPKRNHDGYLRVQLWEKGHCEFVAVHRLIATAFSPNPYNKPFVNHRNGNKQDNRAVNLEWVTQKENIAHAWNTGLSHRPLNTCGKQYAMYDKDGTFIKSFPSTMEIERELGISHTNVSQAAKRNGTAHGYRWKEVIP